ncbi:hypothetical protein DFJ58DRAFT_837071 [Suillus subalutaceus]|uniref:uncharacterized protein n=1 Tax=Suillus subalutaceus TaxID=48586 RepID=UPI001B877B33|nr:uncharacterized protein DFJ58DRAFT_837071 [Suillus subalutaceus]KAG1871750.1 hypothetical protein DFJ58DRAFT_837071 [Suillus subalutaceus]
MIQNSEYHRGAIDQFHVLVVLFQLSSKYIPELSGMLQEHGGDDASLCELYLPFIVQSFYCHRVWITAYTVSGNNIYVTIPIILFAASSYVLIPPQQAGAFLNDAVLKISVARALQTVLCDSMISLSVYFYLRSARSGVHRLLAISICILYWANSTVVIRRCRHGSQKFICKFVTVHTQRREAT